MLSTKTAGKLSASEKAEKINKLRQYHAPLLREYDIPEKDFNGKLVFTNNQQKIVGIFASEFMKENGFYMEFIDNNLEPADPSRKVYKLKHTPNYEDVYSLLPSGTYAVPIEELDVLGFPQKKSALEFDYTKVNEKDSGLNDESFSKMTIRDIAAILWQKPVSNKPWLNELIESAENMI